MVDIELSFDDFVKVFGTLLLILILSCWVIHNLFGLGIWSKCWIYEGEVYLNLLDGGGLRVFGLDNKSPLNKFGEDVLVTLWRWILLLFLDDLETDLLLISCLKICYNDDIFYFWLLITILDNFLLLRDDVRLLCDGKDD